MTAMLEEGTIAVLNCGTGDTTFNFKSDDEEEVETARDIVESMLRRGYCLSVKVGDRMERITAFDPKTDEYVVTDRPPAEPVAPAPPAAGGEPVAPAPAPAVIGSRRGRPLGSKNRIKAAGASVVAVGRTAGGGLCVRHFPVHRWEIPGA